VALTFIPRDFFAWCCSVAQTCGKSIIEMGAMASWEEEVVLEGFLQV